MEKNNYSRNFCSYIAEKNTWNKENYRNVVTINGIKWSVSLASENGDQCRQMYDDCAGYIILDEQNREARQYAVKNPSMFNVSRISPTGIKAYNVRMDKMSSTVIPCVF